MSYEYDISDEIRYEPDSSQSIFHQLGQIESNPLQFYKLNAEEIPQKEYSNRKEQKEEEMKSLEHRRFPQTNILNELQGDYVTPQTIYNSEEEKSNSSSSGCSSACPTEKKKSPSNSTTKNIMGYQSKKVINLMFKKHSTYITKKCKKANISFRSFKRYYLSEQKKLYGPMSLNNMFKIEGNSESDEARMKKLFQRIFNKILRKEYLLYSLRLGKMHKVELYIKEKNTKLLYYTESQKKKTQVLQKQSI